MNKRHGLGSLTVNARNARHQPETPDNPSAPELVKILLRDWSFIAAAAALLIFYIAVLVSSPLRVFWMPDEGAKWLEMQSVSVHPPADLRYHVDFPALRLDHEFNYLPHPVLYPQPVMAWDGSVYLSFETSAVFPLLSGLFLRFFGVIGIYVLPLLSGWLAAVVAGVLAAAVRPAAAAPTLVLVGVATPVWFYSMLFWEHTLASCLALVAVAAVAATRPRSLLGVLVAGFALVGAATFRLETLAIALALAVAWYARGPRSRPTESEDPKQRERSVSIAGSLGWLVVAVGAVWFLQESLTSRHSFLIGQLPRSLQDGIGTMLQSPWSLLDLFVHISIDEAPRVSDALVAAAGAGVLLCLAAAFSHSSRRERALLLPGLALVLAFSISVLCIGTRYRALHGFVPIAPFIVVAPYAWTASRREDRSGVLRLLVTVFAVGCAANVVAISTIYLKAGRLAVAIEWGQRYMLTLYPIAAVLAVVAIQVYWRSPRPRWLRWLFVAAVSSMALVGVGFQIRGNLMLYNTRVQLTALEAAMRREGPLVTDVWWLPAAFAVFYSEHEMYYVRAPIDVAHWVAVAAPLGIRGFTFVSLAPVKAGDLGTKAIRRSADQPHPVQGAVLTRFELKNPIEPAPYLAE